MLHEIETATKYRLMFFLLLMSEMGTRISDVFEEVSECPYSIVGHE